MEAARVKRTWEHEAMARTRMQRQQDRNRCGHGLSPKRHIRQRLQRSRRQGRRIGHGESVRLLLQTAKARAQTTMRPPPHSHLPHPSLMAVTAPHPHPNRLGNNLRINLTLTPPTPWRGHHWRTTAQPFLFQHQHCSPTPCSRPNCLPTPPPPTCLPFGPRKQSSSRTLPALYSRDMTSRPSWLPSPTPRRHHRNPTSPLPRSAR
ncbi:hypothetical protein IWZ03DRAFT_384181 [Phyllosticta citriasiana]|uniref:Uncharacterized protein n=1 Tax=Phyllosticta citriasiana TaxID=595635 RepID=A0ABR1KDI1_9PEZI